MKKWTRNPTVRLIMELAAGVASGMVVGMVILEPLYAHLSLSFAGESGWVEYAIYGACGALGAHIFGRIRRSLTRDAS